MRILIVEDDRVAQTIAKYLVGAFNVDYDVASTAQEAIDYANNTSYDLILMDIGLDAGNDGFKVTGEIRKSSKMNATTPVVAVTAHIEEGYQQKADAVGMLAIINKPLKEAILKNYLDQLK